MVPRGFFLWCTTVSPTVDAQTIRVERYRRQITVPYTLLPFQHTTTIQPAPCHLRQTRPFGLWENTLVIQYVDLNLPPHLTRPIHLTWADETGFQIASLCALATVEAAARVRNCANHLRGGSVPLSVRTGRGALLALIRPRDDLIRTNDCGIPAARGPEIPQAPACGEAGGALPLAFRARRLRERAWRAAVL